METRQLEHEGFEHTDEFRVPRNGEWYQCCGSPNLQPKPIMSGGFPDETQHGGKRWILRKKPVKAECGCTQEAKFSPTYSFSDKERPHQKCFEGFEHTGEYRHPKLSEWFQTFYEPISAEQCLIVNTQANNDVRLNRWILRKTEDRPSQKQFDGFEHTNVFGWPKKGEWYQGPGPSYSKATHDWAQTDCKRWILVKEEDSYKKLVEELEKELAADEATRDLQRKRIGELVIKLDSADKDLALVQRLVRNLGFSYENLLAFFDRQPKPTDAAS